MVTRCSVPPCPQSVTHKLGLVIFPEGSPRPHTVLQWEGGVDTCLVHLRPPTHLDLIIHTPLPFKASRQGVCPTGGRGATVEAAPGHGPRGPSSVGFRYPRLRKVSARCGSVWGRRGSALPCPVHPEREGRDNLPPVPLICMRGGSGWGPTSNSGGGHPRKGDNRGASYPESGTDEGPSILLPGLQREGSF